MMALAGGLALEAGPLWVRIASAGLAAFMLIPFLYTQSRASYLGFLPAYVVLVALTRRRRLAIGVLFAGLVAGFVFLPAPVHKRILETFQEQPYQPVVRVGGVGFDPSTSERLLAMRSAFEGWTKRPILGYGVTGYHFMDAQYARALVETGIIGFAAFLYLLWTVWWSSFQTYRQAEDPNLRALAAGFLAGFVGLLVHAVGSNTFIIIRIMEPFWFFVGLLVVWPHLAPAGGQPEPAKR
ncbi:MAG: O-antigen ligase family protein [Elusimicrobia bacterium]|nr:O-antigen ligase family protein [Elusimicrobiota bacterium]